MFDDLDNVFVTVDPQLGPIAIGYDESVPAICAWDMRAGKPLWEALTENEDIGDLEIDNFGVHGHNVYLWLGGTLFCLDLATGGKKWTRELANEVDLVDHARRRVDEVRGPTHLLHRLGEAAHAVRRDRGDVAELERERHVERAERCGIERVVDLSRQPQERRASPVHSLDDEPAHPPTSRPTSSAHEKEE